MKSSNKKRIGQSKLMKKQTFEQNKNSYRSGINIQANQIYGRNCID